MRFSPVEGPLKEALKSARPSLVRRNGASASMPRISSTTLSLVRVRAGRGFPGVTWKPLAHVVRAWECRTAERLEEPSLTAAACLAADTPLILSARAPTTARAPRAPEAKGDRRSPSPWSAWYAVRQSRRNRKPPEVPAHRSDPARSRASTQAESGEQCLLTTKRHQTIQVMLRCASIESRLTDRPVDRYIGHER